MEIGTCKLCREKKPLLKKSHIIPDWMYFGLFDEKHKTAMIDLEVMKEKRSSTGAYESNILCLSCDNKVLGSLENHGKQTLCVNGRFVDFFSSHTFSLGGTLKSANFTVKDYTKFKLFLLTLLWKMHVSSHHLFRQVDLGPHHSERLRHAILNGEKIGENEYEVAIVAIQNLPDLIINLINTPRKIQQPGNTYYIALINGLIFMFNISPQNKSDLIVKSRLMENGLMKVPLLENELAKLFYDSLSGVRMRRRLNGK